MRNQAGKWAVGGVIALACAMTGGVMAQNLSEKHFSQASNPDATRSAVLTSAIVEISIQHTGSGPQYGAVLKADGTATFAGIQNAPRQGEFAGTVTAAAFQTLADQAVQIGYVNFKNTYKASKMDLPSVYTAVKTASGEKVVLNYGGKGPAELAAFEAAIDQALERISWAQR